MVTIAIVMIVMVAVRDAFAAPSALAVATPFCGCYIRRSSRSSSSSSSSSSSDNSGCSSSSSSTSSRSSRSSSQQQEQLSCGVLVVVVVKAKGGKLAECFGLLGGIGCVRVGSIKSNS